MSLRSRLCSLYTWARCRRCNLAVSFARVYPALGAVKIYLLVDAAANMKAGASNALPEGQKLAGAADNLKARAARALPGDTQKKLEQGKGWLAGAAAEAGRITKEYGLAYMAAKNVLGPVCSNHDSSVFLSCSRSSNALFPMFCIHNSSKLKLDTTYGNCSLSTTFRA